MARIECEVRHTVSPKDSGLMVAGVEVTCNECGHCERSFGETELSVRRCLALLRENCPEGDDNYYVTDED